MANGGRLGARNVPGVDGYSGVWSLREIADAVRKGIWKPYLDLVLEDNPLVYYRLDETSGTAAADSSGNGNNGTYIGGPTLNQGPLILDGRAVSFDGSNDQIDGPALNLLGNVTVEAWYMPAALPSNAYVLSHGGAAVSEAEEDNASYSIYVSGSSLSMLWEYGGGSNVIVPSGTTLVVGTPYHIIMERDATEKTVTFTVNGVTNVVSYSTNPTGGGNGILRVGFFANAARANGVIDEVAVYDHLLGATRVAAHYNAGIAQ